MMAYGASSAVQRHVRESLEGWYCCCGGGGGGGSRGGGGGAPSAGAGRGSAAGGLRGIAQELEMGHRGRAGSSGIGEDTASTSAGGTGGAGGGGGGGGSLDSGRQLGVSQPISGSAGAREGDGTEVLLEIDLSSDD